MISIPEKPARPNLRKDLNSVLLLLLLYILQGVPLGLIMTVPFLLQSQGVPYTEQAKFSLAFWPFGLKILYAPVIDAIYFKRMGRRKSWLVPMQYLISLFMFILAFKVEALMASRDVTAMTIMFFMLNFLAASQDVAVDGWAITMLSPENVGYASTCNGLGQTLGFVCGYSVFLALESPDFANKFRSVPGDTGLVDLPQFLFFWAIVFAVTTTLVLLFKHEKDEPPEIDEHHMNILGSYRSLWRILKLPNIRILIVFFLTAKIGTAAMDTMTKLKLVEAGIAKETIAFFSIPLIPIKLLIPLVASKWIVRETPMKLYINCYPICLVLGLLFPVMVYFVPYFRDSDGHYSTLVYFGAFAIFAIDLIPKYTKFLCQMSFSARISDPGIGGTYMTLINTIANVGGMWPMTVALWLVDYLNINYRTEGDCPRSSIFFPRSSFGGPGGQSHGNESFYHSGSTEVPTSSLSLHLLDSNSSRLQEGPGHDLGLLPTCVTKIDGYYIETVICVALGVLWLIWGRPTILRLQERPKSSWRVIQGVDEPSVELPLKVTSKGNGHCPPPHDLEKVDEGQPMTLTSKNP